MAVKVKDRLTADGKKLEKTIEELNRLEVRIGIQNGAKNRDGANLVDIAMFNELGTVHIPSRPFLRDSVDAHANEINDFLQSVGQYIARGGTADGALTKIGTFQKGLIKNEIIKGDFVPNSEETIRRKKSATPLVNYGDLRGAINYEIREKGGSD